VDYEELTLDGSEPGGSPGLRPLTWVVLAVGCVLAGVVVMLLRPPADPAAAPPPPSPAVSPPTWPDANLAGGRGVNLSSNTLTLGRICTPVTDGRRTLALSFTLVNESSIAITLIDVEPVLPIGGLQPRRPNTAGGTCEHPDTQAPGGLLAPGATQLITLRFGLPEQCPQPFPVQARINLRAQQMVGMTTVAVYRDLGAIDFDSCADER
jgi:hypothetical protein